MTEYSFWIILITLVLLAVLLDRKMKRPALRTWLGFALIVTSPTLLFGATRWVTELQFDSIPVLAFSYGIRLLVTRNSYRLQRNPPPHPLPLTIGMLYLAIKTHSWDTQTLENLS